MSSNDNIQKCCGCIYQLYDFVVVDVYSSESAIVKCSIPSCHHICCCCHADSCQWVSSPDLVLNESSCLHCQLFECNNCCSTVASITTPFPAILSLLPGISRAQETASRPASFASYRSPLPPIVTNRWSSTILIVWYMLVPSLPKDSINRSRSLRSCSSTFIRS